MKRNKSLYIMNAQYKNRIGIKLSIIISISVLLFSACSLIFEADISDSVVNILSPTDSLKTTENEITFWWDKVPDAENYNLQIVSPSWDLIDALIVDTNLSGNKYTMMLSPGDYDWGVSAYNNSSSTSYSVQHLIIDTTSNLTNQRVTLKTPLDNSYTNSKTIKFVWYPLNAAESYDFNIRIDSWDGEDAVQTVKTSGINTTVNLDADGKYYWGVQARNSSSYTFSVKPRLITLDTEAPSSPEITNPENPGDTLDKKNPVLTWARPTSLSPIAYDSVIIDTTSDFNPKSLMSFKVVEKPEFIPASYGFQTGIYFFKVKSIDAAGNVGTASASRKFYLNEE
jgi:hypothetical protein